MRELKTVLFSVLLFALFTNLSLAQVKTFQEVVGHEIGERIVKSHQVNAYLKYLAEASDRIELHYLGRTWNHKDQYYVLLSSPENLARADEINENAHRLNDPRTTNQSQANEIIQNQPSVLYLGGSIHGFELSGTEGVLWLLEHFTTSNDAETLEQLRNTFMVVDPLINSDGRDAFAQFNHQHTGRLHTSDRADWNNSFRGWDGVKYRTSHYYFDMNRDWFAHTHPEIANRAELIQKWRPQVGVDAHEMGPDTEFYFDPPTDPVSPVFPPFATKWFEEFGKAHAAAFDEAGIEYTFGEIFNYFHPAYTTSYLSYQGAVGMLYEQGSSRGLAFDRSDESTRTLREAAYQQYIAFRAMVKLSSDKRAELLQDYYRANVETLDWSREANRFYFIPENGGDPNIIIEMVNSLMRSGIEIHQLDNEISVRSTRDRTATDSGRQTFPAGTYVIDMHQPRARFIRVLMDPTVEVPEDFLEIARERLNRGQNPRFYDMTTFSMPMLYNVEAFGTRENLSMSKTKITDYVERNIVLPEAPAQYAYIIDGRQTASMAVLYHVLADGARARVLTVPTQINGVSYGSGSVIIRSVENRDHIFELVTRLANHYKVNVTALDSGRADEGFPPLGSVEGNHLKHPNIALIANHPVSAYSFGWTWFMLDRQYEIPHIILNAHNVGSTPLERFDTIILPALSDTSAFSAMLGNRGKDRLRNWVRDGGNLVAYSSGADYVRRSLGLAGLVNFYEEEENRRLQRVSVPGAFFRGTLDHEHWLTSGYDSELTIFVNSASVYRAPDGPPSTARNWPLIIGSDDNAHISGHVWEENIERLPESVVVYEQRNGRGRVVLFTEDPNYRGYLRSMDRMFLNAVIMGTGF